MPAVNTASLPFVPSYASYKKPLGADGGVDPLGLLLGAGSGLAGGIAGAIANANNAKRQAQQAQQQQQLTRDMSTADIATKESSEDPFRQQMAQAGDLSKLDQLAGAKYTPFKLQPTGPYAGDVPQFSGGFSYEKSPELIADARTLQANVRGGNVDPTMTDPTNYGKTGALDLVRIAAGGVDPSTVSGSAGAPKNPDAYLTGAQTRTAGGIGTAETRGSDVSVDTATQIITKAIQDSQGRNPNPGEIARMLAGQGLKPGDRWVGHGGLLYILNVLGGQAPSQPSYTGRG